MQTIFLGPDLEPVESGLSPLGLGDRDLLLLFPWDLLPFLAGEGDLLPGLTSLAISSFESLECENLHWSPLVHVP